MTFKASVIIPTCGRPELLRQALLSLQSQRFPAEHFETIVVSNGPQPLDIRTAGVRAIHEPRAGLHHARHAGAREATAPILVYIDDDVICPETWLSEIIAPFANDEVGMVAGRVKLRFEREAPLWLKRYAPLLSELDWGDLARRCKSGESPVGCNMAVRRELLFQAGGFNPDAFAERGMQYLRGDGECGLARKIQAAGHDVWYAPTAWLEHRIPAERMRSEYIDQRSKLAGIEEAYIDLRYNNPSRCRIFLSALRCGLNWKAHRIYFRLGTKTEKRIYDRAMACRYQYRALQRFRQVFSRRLRDYTRQQSYL